jgi:hypothetical protein
VLTQEELDLEIEPPDEHLVARNRARRHVVLPIDDLVPHPVLRKQQEIVVGEARTAINGLHRVVCFHAGHRISSPSRMAELP